MQLYGEVAEVAEEVSVAVLVALLVAEVAVAVSFGPRLVAVPVDAVAVAVVVEV